MTTQQQDTSMGIGVYFALDDYVGIIRRIVILLVDLAVLFIMYLLFAALLIPIAGAHSGSVGLLYVGTAWAYLTVLKSSRLRTVGYRLMGARIINLRGRRPSAFRMTFRVLLWLFGPFNMIDLIWSNVDKERQTLRDRFAGTCVVNNQAQPIGTGEIKFKYSYAFGLSLVYSQVTRSERLDTEIGPSR